jgi:hypothetical protein
VALSPFTPIGAVRQVEPSPGVHLDGTVLGAGVGIFVLGLGAVAVALAVVTTRLRAVRPRAAAPGSSGIASGAIRLGLPPASVTGIRFAVERGRGRDAVPVGSALVGAALAVAVVVATVTFGSGLHTLVSHPELYGWNWSYAIAETGGGSVPAVTDGMLAHDHAVARWTGFGFADAQIDGQTIPILLTRARAPVTPPILSGRAVQGDHEIVVGGGSLAQLHKHVGDTVSITYGTPQDAPIYVPPTTVRIVGTATLRRSATRERCTPPWGPAPSCPPASSHPPCSTPCWAPIPT